MCMLVFCTEINEWMYNLSDRNLNMYVYSIGPPVKDYILTVLVYRILFCWRER